MDTKLSIIIFSKDRACQLDALLRSIQINVFIPHEIHIIYSHSTCDFSKGYEKLMLNDNPADVLWHSEVDFQKDLKSLVASIKAPYTVFMVDDMIVKGTIQEDKVFNMFEKHPDVLGLVLRLGRDIDADAKKAGVDIPLNSQNLWYWEGCGVKGWNYPMSVDGTIFRTADLKDYIAGLSFKKPNSFEAAMSRCPLGRPLLLCHDKAKTVNLAINKVQTEVRKNQCGSISEQFLNELWLDGIRIAINPIMELEHNQRHIILPCITFENYGSTA